MVKVAIAYDFDGTLAKGNIQENSFIPKLDLDKGEFWDEVKILSEENNMDEILSYMHLITKKANDKGQRITKEDLKEHGKNVIYFKGVEEYFGRINKYANEKGVEIHHYIISSGTKEMIEGTTIADKFDNIYASSFMYNNYGQPIWPALAINYTTKTQYLYRINKGIHNAWDNKSINKFIPEDERDIVFENMIYIGDGETDIPAMTLLKSKGGTSIAVYDEKSEIADKLIEQNRVNYVAMADYSVDGAIDKIIKSVIDRVKLDTLYGKNNLIKETSLNYAPLEQSECTQEIKIEQCLKLLNTDGFKSEPKAHVNKIYLKRSDWNDHNYRTSFYIWNNGEYLGQVKIAYKDQKINQHTADIIDKEFDKLPERFFSIIQELREDNVSQEQKNALKYLLNDISETTKYDNETVVLKSLKRDRI
ncbi:MAG: HAD family hydrolase [Sulfurospirillaceae bacterium]|nr:HAD family hydrolase [Sulfurospirillaceae bacterium]